MKAMLMGFAAIAVITIAAPYVLEGLGYSSQERNAGNSVRID